MSRIRSQRYGEREEDHKAAFPKSSLKATIKGLSTETKGKKTYFEIESVEEKGARGEAMSYKEVLRVGKTGLEMSVDPTGKVLKDSQTTM